jgi:hypothetical protein
VGVGTAQHDELVQGVPQRAPRSLSCWQCDLHAFMLAYHSPRKLCSVKVMGQIPLGSHILRHFHCSKAVHHCFTVLYCTVLFSHVMLSQGCTPTTLLCCAVLPR